MRVFRRQRSEIRLQMERNQRSEWVRGFEDLEVFRRAYRVSLEVHRASLEFPAIEQRALADQIRRGPQTLLRPLGGRVGPPTVLPTRDRPLGDIGLGPRRRECGVSRDV